MHYKADNNISDKSRRVLIEENKDSIYNLDNNRMLKNFDELKEPSFKEVASMVRASINFIYKIDSKLLKKVDSVKYADKVIYYYIKEDKIKRLDNLFSKDENSRERIIKNILENYGFNEKEDRNVDNFILKLKCYKFDDAKKKYEKGSFL